MKNRFGIGKYVGITADLDLRHLLCLPGSQGPDPESWCAVIDDYFFSLEDAENLKQILGLINRDTPVSGWVYRLTELSPDHGASIILQEEFIEPILPKSLLETDPFFGLRRKLTERYLELRKIENPETLNEHTGVLPPAVGIPLDAIPYSAWGGKIPYWVTHDKLKTALV